MKAVEFQSELSSDHLLKVPAGVADRIPQGRPLRVVVLVAEDDEAWKQMAAAEFGSGYADSDAIYDQQSTR